MSRRRLGVEIQKEIERLKSLGFSQRKVAKILGINKDTVNKYWNGLLGDKRRIPPEWAQKIDWSFIQKELKTVPIKIIYEELKEFYQVPSYQAFCSYLTKNICIHTPEVTIKIDRSPGASVEVDYSGDSVQILNPATEELYSVALFAGALSYSGKIYAEFTRSQKLEDFIRSHNNMFAYYGGTTSYIIPDNCKTAVTKANYYDPVLNPSYHDMCKHYGIVVDPADKQSPRHKPNVEKAISYLQTDFLPRIRRRTFASLFELNKELKNWLNVANARLIQGRGQSRDFFFEREKEYLRPLGQGLYELFYFKKAKVHPDCHFQHQKNYYSVPHQYVGTEIDIKFNSNLVHVYYECERIVTHKCMKGTYHWSTNHSHYPEKKYMEFNYHLGRLKKNAAVVGQNTSILTERLISESKYPLKVIRKAQGILRLENTFGREALDYACGEALEFNTLNFDNVRKFARNFNYRPKEEMSTPKRQLELICLQGGNYE